MDQNLQTTLVHEVLQHIDAGTTQLADEIYANPVSNYTSTDRLSTELEVLFRQRPLLVGLSCQLPEPGDFLTCDYTGIPQLIVRGEDRTVRAFMNVCRHRGARVAEGHGNTRKRFRCPYHGWNYDTSGKLVGIPDTQSFPGIDRPACGLIPLPVTESDGMIWASATPAQTSDVSTKIDNQARALVRLGIVPGDVVMHASVLSMWIAGIPGVDSMMAYGVCLVPVGALSGVERVAQIARDTRPKSIKCTVSFAQYLAKHMEERTGIDPATLGLEKVVVFGEPGGSIPEIYEPLEKGFGGAMVHDIMGATGCHSPTGISCEEHNGIHFYAEDNAMFEICDPESLQSLPVEDGVEGEIVFTGLERECGPLIRWRDKDIIQVTTEPCRCGRPGPRMLFKGRVDDMLLVKGVNVFPNAVRDVIIKTSDLTTGNIRIVKSGPGPVVPAPVLVKVEVKARLPDQKKQALAGDLDNAIHHQLRFRATFEFIDEGEFELLKGATGKTRLVEQIGE